MLPNPVIHYLWKLTYPSTYIFLVSYITDRTAELLHFKAERQEF